MLYNFIIFLLFTTVTKSKSELIESTEADSISQDVKCGIRNQDVIDPALASSLDNDANYAEFPWIIQIRLKNYEGIVTKICGGSLITPNVVITVAYCVTKKNIGDKRYLTIRAGDWNINSTTEKKPYQESKVENIIIHPNFDPNQIYNGIALIVLKTPMEMAENIGTICLPSQEFVDVGNECFVSGWGEVFNETDCKLSAILKKVKVPVVVHDECEKVLRTTYLGPTFELHESFICAGDEQSPNPCMGDGGSPLMCPDPNNVERYQLIGLVSRNTKTDSMPFLYTDVAKYRNWVDEELEKMGINGTYYYTI